MITKLLTRLLFFLLLVCFFFPFIPQACNSGSAADGSTVDSTEVPMPQIVDTAAVDSSLNHEVDSLGEKISARDTTITNKDSISPNEPEKSKIFQFILSPDEENLSGIGVLILSHNWIFFNSGFLIAMLSVILGLALSFGPGKYRLWILKLSVVNMIAWTMMLFSMFKDAKLGIWMGTGISLALFILQLSGYWQHKKKSA